MVGSKIRHFRELKATTGLEYSDMLFFDDETRNSEVESLGVTFILIESDGVTKSIFENGLQEWRRRRKITQEECIETIKE
jgi:magnesium-dependent phosphatase 1